MPDFAPLIDSHGRVHTNLRISVTDRCNIRCFYCMPNENVRFKPRKELLTFEEIERFVRVVARMGVCKLRLTGGEPLLHPQIDEIVAGLVQRRKYVYLCTNAILLKQHLHRFQPTKYLSFSIHLDGLCQEHDKAVCREGVFDIAIDAVKDAISNNTYLTHDRLDIAVNRMIDEMIG